LLFTLMASVFPMLIWSPVFPASSATRQGFSCASWCLWERRLMSSAKSRSSSCQVKVHWIPVLRPAVDCRITQSTTIRKTVGKSRQLWRTPVCTVKGSVSFPSWITWQVASSYICNTVRCNVGQAILCTVCAKYTVLHDYRPSTLYSRTIIYDISWNFAHTLLALSLVYIRET
jgi:hypothetical protein